VTVRLFPLFFFFFLCSRLPFIASFLIFRCVVLCCCICVLSSQFRVSICWKPLLRQDKVCSLLLLVSPLLLFLFCSLPFSCCSVSDLPSHPSSLSPSHLFFLVLLSHVRCLFPRQEAQPDRQNSSQ
jgi:hypothetical protein